MLSSEKSLAYWHDLRLFVERKEYPRANLFARGCLELYLYNYVRKKSDLEESWKYYRAGSGVLEDEFLEQYQIEKASDQNIERVFSEVAKVLDFHDAKQVYKWALKFFRDSPNLIPDITGELYFLLNYSGNEEYKNIQNIELPKDISQKARDFCNHVRRRTSRLKEHFRIADEVYLMSLPSEWEMLLQDCFYEGARNCYWWMHSVKFSLEYINFYRRWKELKADIGNEYINILLDWLEKNQNNFPERYYRVNEIELTKLREL